MDQTISKTESAILHTYNRYDLVLEKGDGAYLYDTCLLYTSDAADD